MAKSSVVLLALSALAVQSAVLYHEDTLLKRVVRSPCEECDRHGPPPPPPPFWPPPPPLRFHSHNWSGYARGSDGGQEVFSGAAAAAGLGAQTGSQAFSIASASGNAAADSASKVGADAAGATSGANSGVAGGYGSGAGIKGGYGGSTGNTQAQSNGFNGGSNFQSSKYKESHYSYQSGGHKNFDGQGGSKDFDQRGDIGGQGSQNAQSGSFANSGAASQGFFGNEQQQQYGGGFNGNGDSQSQSHSFSSQGGSGKLHHANQEQGFSGSNQRQYQGQYSGQQQSSDFVSGSSSNAQSGAFSGQGGQHSNGVAQHLENQQQAHSGWQKEGYKSGGASGQAGGSLGVSGPTGFDGGQSALNGALNLASEGLQSAQDLQTTPGCSTCGKSGYALSNAKSHSGNAIALSIGG